MDSVQFIKINDDLNAEVNEKLSGFGVSTACGSGRLIFHL